jgi:hypothetical protein
MCVAINNAGQRESRVAKLSVQGKDKGFRKVQDKVAGGSS